MASTNIPAKADDKNVRIQYKTLGDDQYNFDMDQLYIQELLNLLVNCKYKAAGCIVNDYVKDIKIHEGRCLYRKLDCPVRSNEELCKDVMVMNLVEHMTRHHKSSCLSTKEKIVSLPVDLAKETTTSKMITILEDVILVCNVKIDNQKLHTSLVFIRNTNPFIHCDITLMADDMKWNNQKIQISHTVSGFNEYNEQSVVFDLEKLIQLKSAFSSIVVRIECNIAVQENIAQSKEFLQKVICAYCGDFLSNEYYECQEKHMYCDACYVLKKFSVIRAVKVVGRHLTNYDAKQCRRCNLQISENKQYLTLIDSLKKYEFPCQNLSLGCKQYVPLFTSKHELLCPFKVFKCINARCNFSGKYSNFISHLQEEHTDIIITTNVHNLNPNNLTTHYMFAFGSVFLYKMFDKQTCTIEWISTSVLNHNFIFEVTFVGEGNRITLRTNTDPRETNFKTEYYKSIYNTIKKTAYFRVYEELTIVGEIILKIHKM